MTDFTKIESIFYNCLYFIELNYNKGKLVKVFIVMKICLILYFRIMI